MDDAPRKPSTDLVIPGTYEVVSWEDPRAISLAYDAVQDLERQLKQTKNELREALKWHSSVMGTKTMHLEGGVTATLKGGTEKVYDVDKIESDLLAAGMPERNVKAIVREKLTREIVYAKAEQARKANPVYREIIDQHTREVPKQPSVSIEIVEVIEDDA